MGLEAEAKAWDGSRSRSQSLRWVSKQSLLLTWRVTVEIGDGAWGEGWGWDRRWRVRVRVRVRSSMEGEARVLDRRWRDRRGFLIGDGGWRWRLQIGEMGSERVDGGWSGSKEGDRVDFGSEENKRKNSRRDFGPNIKDTGLRPRFIKRGLRPTQKKRGYTCQKRGLRPGLRPRLKNVAGPFIFKPRFLKRGFRQFWAAFFKTQPEPPRFVVKVIFFLIKYVQ